MDTTIVLQQLFVLFALMSVGFWFRRTNVITQDHIAFLTQIVLKAIIPATLVSGVMGASGQLENMYLFYVIGLSLLVYFILGLVAVIATYLTRPKNSEDSGALISLGTFGNIAYLGIPLTIAFWGPENVFYAVLFNLISNLLAFSIGIKILAGAKAKISLKLIFNTLMNTSIVAIILFLFSVQLPEILLAPLIHLRSMLTPMGMMILGAILGGMAIKEVFSGWRVYVAVAVKLLIGPVVVFFILSQFIANPVVLGIFTLLAASPTAPRTALLALKHGGNFTLVSQGVVLGTALSLITIPLLIQFLGL